jgi:hypothetical protein
LALVILNYIGIVLDIVLEYTIRVIFLNFGSIEIDDLVEIDVC